MIQFSFLAKYKIPFHLNLQQFPAESCRQNLSDEIFFFGEKVSGGNVFRKFSVSGGNYQNSGFQLIFSEIFLFSGGHFVDANWKLYVQFVCTCVCISKLRDYL